MFEQFPTNPKQDESEQVEFEAKLDELNSADWAKAMAVFSATLAQSHLRTERDSPLILAGLTDWLKAKAKGSARDWFLEWWLAYLEAMSAYEMLDGWITSPFHTADDDEVRRQVRDQVIALSKKAKQKLAKRLRERAKALRERAKKLRDEGKNDQANRVERQAAEFDIAADEVDKQTK